MKSFSDKFISTLILNVAAISAIIVGIVSFAIRVWNENNYTEKTKENISNVLNYLNSLLQEPTPVTVAQVSTKRTKRS